MRAWAWRAVIPTVLGLLLGACGGGGTGGPPAIEPPPPPPPALPGTWDTVAALPQLRTEVSATVHDGELYIAGGLAPPGGNALAVYVYNPAGDDWRVLTSLPAQRHHTGIAIVDGRLCVLGGESFGGGGRTFDEVERYDPVANTWQAVAPMPTARHGLGAGALGDAIHAVAGGPAPGFTYSAVHQRLTGL